MPRPRILALAALALLLLQPLLAAPARAWWSGDWPYRMKIDADLGPKAANITDPIGRTQVLVRLFSGNFNFSTVKDDGSDIRFVGGDDKTPLHFHLARFDPLVDQVALAWVDIADLAPGTTTSFYLYWGNKNATPGGDPRATYDPDQVIVYHFGDENGLPKDSTANALNALTGGKRVDSGITGFALRLDGTAPVHLPQSPLLNLAAGQGATWSMWLQVDDANNTAALLDTRDANASFTIGLDHGVAYAEIAQAGQPAQRTSPGTALKGGAWHLLDVVADAGKIAVFVDGVASGELAAPLPAIAGSTLLGGSLAVAAPAPPAPPAPAPAAAAASPAPAVSNQAVAGAALPAAPVVAPAIVPAPAFVGLLDEFEYSKVARPLGAIRLAANVQGPSANVFTFDKPEESSVFGTGYIGIILKSVTPDAWVVIGILGVMMVISWFVMIAKAVYVGRINRANRVFRADFERAADEDTASHLVEISDQKRPALRGSPLWRLYTAGSAELRARFARGRLVPGEPVPPQSLTAIRSALDAVYVRENRRLNGLMVLLTIAIAGGPFIGLLGTVIGVMITFAAIAAAGDVNVNAIAPGISAALLATVAGLAVAIPALFGYNYFTIKIRDASQEMQVFIEELVARIGEGAMPRRAGIIAERVAHAAIEPAMQPAPGE